MRSLTPTTILLPLFAVVLIIGGFMLPTIASSATDQRLLLQSLTMQDEPSALVFEEARTNANASPAERLKLFNDLISRSASSILLHDGAALDESDALAIAKDVGTYFGIETDQGSTQCDVVLMTDGDHAGVYGIFWNCSINENGDTVWIDDQSGLPVGFTLTPSFESLTGESEKSYEAAKALIAEGYGFDPVHDDAKIEKILREDTIDDDQAASIMKKRSSRVEEAMMQAISHLFEKYYSTAAFEIDQLNETLMIVGFPDEDDPENPIRIPLDCDAFDIICEFNVLPLDDLLILEDESYGNAVAAVDAEIADYGF